MKRYIWIHLFLIIVFISCDDAGTSDNDSINYPDPVISSFSLTSEVTTVDPLVTFDLEVSDDVTHYLISETPHVEKPALDDPLWVAEKPSSYTLSVTEFSDDPVYLYAWVKNPGGKISGSKRISVIFDDIEPPYIYDDDVSRSGNTITIILYATDNVYVQSPQTFIIYGNLLERRVYKTFTFKMCDSSNNCSYKQYSFKAQSL